MELLLVPVIESMTQFKPVSKTVYTHMYEHTTYGLQYPILNISSHQRISCSEYTIFVKSFSQTDVCTPGLIPPSL